MFIQTLGPSYGLKKIFQIFFHSCKNASPLYAHLTRIQTSSFYHHTLTSTPHKKHCYLYYMFTTEQSLVQRKQFQSLLTKARSLLQHKTNFVETLNYHNYFSHLPFIYFALTTSRTPFNVVPSSTVYSSKKINFTLHTNKQIFLLSLTCFIEVVMVMDLWIY